MVYRENMNALRMWRLSIILIYPIVPKPPAKFQFCGSYGSGDALQEWQPLPDIGME